MKIRALTTEDFDELIVIMNAANAIQCGFYASRIAFYRPEVAPFFLDNFLTEVALGCVSAILAILFYRKLSKKETVTDEVERETTWN